MMAILDLIKIDTTPRLVTLDELVHEASAIGGCASGNTSAVTPTTSPSNSNAAPGRR